MVIVKTQTCNSSPLVQLPLLHNPIFANPNQSHHLPLSSQPDLQHMQHPGKCIAPFHRIASPFSPLTNFPPQWYRLPG